MKVRLDLVKARLRAPFVSSSGAISARELLLLRIVDSQGSVGAGEAAPLAGYDELTIGEVRDALEDCRTTLMRAHWLDRAEILAECSGLAELPPALAAIDLALWDLAGRQAGQPVWRLLGAMEALPVSVNATIGAMDRAGAAAAAAAARAEGFSCVKVKVGAGDDGGRLAAVRAAVGRDVAIRIDANGVWSVDQAIASLRAFEPIGIELCEQPVAGVKEIASVARATNVPIGIDESAAARGALDKRCCEAVCLKIVRCGGISGLIDAARRARSAGYSVYLASTLDGPLGIAAALHAAAVVRPDRPSGLGTLTMFEQQPNPIPVSGGFMRVPEGVGLGDGLRAWYGRL